jgi:hypothetical protein
MLLFDWLEDHKWAGIEYLEELLEEDDITARILKNLRENIKSDIIPKNHITFLVCGGTSSIQCLNLILF